MKRAFLLILAALAALALFYGLVHIVLVAAHLSEPTGPTVYGATPRRMWATAAAALGLVGVVMGGLALRGSGCRIRPGRRRWGAIVALLAGLIAAINGALNLAVATGGPGSGNGVIGAAAAFVLGLIGMTVGGLGLIRSRAKNGMVE